MEKKHLLFSAALAMAFSSNAVAAPEKVNATFDKDVEGFAGAGFKWNEEGKNVTSSAAEGSVLAEGTFSKTVKDLVPGTYKVTVKGTSTAKEGEENKGFFLFAGKMEKAIDGATTLEVEVGEEHELTIGVKIAKDSKLVAVTFDDITLTCIENKEEYKATNTLINSLTKQISENINKINEMHGDVKDTYLIELSKLAATVDVQKQEVAKATEACELYDGTSALKGVDAKIAKVLTDAEAMEVPYDNKDALVAALPAAQCLCKEVEAYINGNSYAKAKCSTEIAALKKDLKTIADKVNAYEPKDGQPDNTAKAADDAAIEQLKKDLAALQTKAEGIQDAGVANAGAYEDASESLETLSNAIEAAKVPYAKYEKATKDNYNFDAIDEAFKSLSTALEDANKAENVKTTYPDGIEKSEAYNKIAEDLETLKAEAAAYNANEVAHNEVEALLTDAQAAYTASTKELYQALSAQVKLYPSDNETNVYADLLAKAQSEMNGEILAKINDAKTASKKSYEGKTAAADQEANKARIPAVDAMNEVVKKYTDVRTAQDGFYAGDVDAITVAQAALDEIKIAEELTQYSKTDIQSAINKLVETVNGAYQKYELDGIKEMATLAKIKSDIETLKNNVADSNEDIQAAATMTSKIAELREALKKAMANVADGAEYNPSNYWSAVNDKITKAIDELEKNAPAVTEKGEAKKYLSDKQGTIDDLTDKIDVLSDDIKTASAKSMEVKGWIADYSKALDAVKEQVKDMSVYQDKSDEYTGDLDKSIKKLQDDLNAALAKTGNEHKAALDAITDPDLSDKIEAVAKKVAEDQAQYDHDNLVASVTNMMGQATTEVKRIQTSFEEIKPTMSNDIKDNAEKEWVLAQMEGEYAEIQKAIEALEEEIAKVKADVEAAEPNWTADLAKLSTIMTGLDDVKTDMGELNTAIEGYKKSYEDWNSALQAWNTAYKALTTTVNKVDGEKVKAQKAADEFKSKTTMDAFAGVMSDINALLTAEQEKANGASAVDNTDDQKKVDEFKGILEAATDAINANEITGAYKKLATNEAAALKNYNAFQEVKKAYGTDSEVIDKAKKTIKTTYDDADVQKVYTDLLAGQQDALDAILTKADGDYKTGDKIGEEAYPAGKAVDTKGARIGEMDEVLAKVQTILNDAEANQAAYDDQQVKLIEDEDLTGKWQAAWDEITGNYDSQPTVLQAYQNELMVVSLAIDALGETVEANYKNGLSAAKKDDVATEIARIKNEITRIQNEASGKYDAAVAAVNKEVDADFQAQIKAAREAYNAAVNDIHDYRQAQGTDWGNVIEGAVSAAQTELFPYDQQIVDLINAEGKAYADTKAPDYFEGQEYIDDAKKLTDDINSVLAKINMQFANEADAFYNGEKGIKVYTTARDAALSHIEDNYKNVTAADQLADVDQKIKDADDAVADAKAANELPLKLGSILETLANEKTGVNALIAIAKDKAAADDMKEVIKPWKEAIAQAKEDLGKLNALGNDKTYSNKLAEQEAIVESVANANITDANYAENLAKLEALEIESIKENVADAQKKNQDNIEDDNNQIAANKLIDMINEYAKDWSDVKDKILSNEAYSEKAIAQYQNDIDGFDDLFDKDNEEGAYAKAEEAREGGYAAEDGIKEGLKWLLDNTKEQYDALEDLIKGAQDDLNANDLETNKENTLAKLPKLIEEYNLAAANNPDNETVKDRSLYNQIAGLEKRIEDCKTVDEVNEIKLEIQQCYYDIAVINDEAKVKAAIAEIDAALTAANTSYNTENDKVYEPEVEDAEAAALKEIKDKLDKLASDIEQAKKDKTILDEANIIKGEIAAVEQAIKNANADAEKMDAEVKAQKEQQKKQDDNDDNYKTLSEQIKKIENVDVVALQESIDDSILGDDMKASLKKEWIGDEKGGFTAMISNLWSQLNSLNEEVALYDDANVGDIQGQIDGANDAIVWANTILAQLVANETVYAELSQSIDGIEAQLAEFEAEFKDYAASVKADKDLIAAKADCEGLLNSVTDNLESNYAYQTLPTQPEGHDKTIGEEIADKIAELQAKINAAIEKAKELQKPYNIVAGDANNDGEVNVKDYNQVLAYTLGKAEAPAKDTPEFKAADASADGEINVADLTAIANIINGLNADGTDKKSVKGRMPVISDSELSLNVEGETVSVELQNEVEFAAIQMDIKSAMPVVAELAERTSNLNLFTNELADGTLRVVIASLDGEMIQGEMGAILSLTGCSDVEIINVVAADAKANAHCIAGTSSNATAIAGVGAEGESSIFSITGIQQRMQKGINIVRSAAGTVKKVLVK